MADSDTESTDPRQVANITFAYLRRIENQLGKIMEVLLRHDTRIGRVERDTGELKRDIAELKGDMMRDVGELKSDMMMMMENRLLTQSNEILTVVQRVDDHQQRLEKATVQQ
jgi:Mg2+ and Co2+ transporter CorA